MSATYKAVSAPKWRWMIEARPGAWLLLADRPLSAEEARREAGMMYTGPESIRPATVEEHWFIV